MSVEGDPTSGTFYIDDLNATFPGGDEDKSQGDDHLRLIKKSIKNTFPSVTAPVTADATELNKLDGVTVTTAEINSLASIGATTVATQLAAKQATITGAATTIDTENLTASRALVSDGSGKVGVSAVTSTELALLSGASSLGGLTVATKSATTSGTTVTKTLSTAGPKRITVTLDNVSTNGTDPLVLKLYYNAVTTTTYVTRISYLKDATSPDVNTDTSFIRIWNNMTASSQISGSITFTLLDAADNFYMASGQFWDAADTTAQAVVVGSFNAYSEIDRVQITTTLGTNTFDGGNFNVATE